MTLPSMTRAVRTSPALLVGLALLCAGGCTFTGAGTKGPGTRPPESTYRPRVECSIGTFGFAWGDAKLQPSTLDGRLLSNEIMDAWKERGYAVGGHFVPVQEFSGQADYNLILTGNQRNSASFGLELLNALTLTLFPYTVTQRYDLTVVLQEVKSNRMYHATVQGWDVTYVSLLVLPAFPFGFSGHRATVEQMADNLYEQFRQQGALDFPCPPAPAPPPSAPPATDELHR